MFNYPSSRDVFVACVSVKAESCENAYFKMDSVLIDERRIHVDFSQSVSMVRWKGKGNVCECTPDNSPTNQLTDWSVCGLQSYKKHACGDNSSKFCLQSSPDTNPSQLQAITNTNPIPKHKNPNLDHTNANPNQNPGQANFPSHLGERWDHFINRPIHEMTDHNVVCRRIVQLSPNSTRACHVSTCHVRRVERV